MEGEGQSFESFSRMVSYEFSLTETGFCQIGDDYIRNTAKAFHFIDKFLIKMSVKQTVIAHNGVNDHSTTLFQEVAFDTFNHFDLINAAQISAYNKIVFKSQAFPVCENGRNIIAEVAESKSRKTAGVGGQDGGR